jgi:hypothetical protein
MLGPEEALLVQFSLHKFPKNKFMSVHYHVHTHVHIKLILEFF